MDPPSLSSSLANATSYLPSPADLLLAVPRLLSRAGLFAEHIDSVFGKIRSGGSIIAEPTPSNVTNATIATTASTFIQESASAAATVAAGTMEDFGFVQALKNISSVLGYITSKWAIATFVTAILLNRTHFYASSRIPLSFDRLHLRIALYLLPTILFVYRIQSVLQAIRCQTSPTWSEMQYGAPGRELDTDFAGEGGLMLRASSALLFWEPLEASCRAVNMLPVDPSETRTAGSLALLWPIFLSLVFGQFTETLSCALQGRRTLQEVGMTIFEHSLAFAEAEAVVTKPLAFDTTRFYKPQSVFTPDGSSVSLSRTTLSSIANVPPEVLLICLISSLSHLTSNLLAIAGVRARFRLLTTGIWGIAYMSSFAWSFSKVATLVSQPGRQVGILRFPTVCIVGFIPHLLILLGITACGAIYLLAFGLTVLSPPPGQPDTLTWKERFSAAYANLHANIHLSAITPLTVNRHEDFYTAIIKIGFTILTAASEAVYLNEGTRINVNSMTWLEKKRLQDLLARRRKFQQDLAPIPRELQGDAMAEGVEVVDRISHDPSGRNLASGYARERKTRGATANSGAGGVGHDPSGVGIHQRRGRWTLTYQFLRSILRLLMAIYAKIIMTMMGKLRITYKPQWLRELAGPQPNEKWRRSPPSSVRSQFSVAPEPWLVIDEQTRIRPSVDFDVEDFARENLRRNGFYDEQGPEQAEQHLTDYLYSWWKNGGRFGNVDTSGDYVPPQEDDATSVVSQATTDATSEWSDMSDGQRTPTQTWPVSFSRESTPGPEHSIDLSRLSHLLDPKTQEDRDEARLLSRHLRSPGVMTRSQFRKEVERDEAKLLTSSRLPIRLSDDIHITPEDEERILEGFILDRRGASSSTQGPSTAGTWNSGAEGMGSEGPQCVVCQLSPRTVLVWPCGCLSLCDECRVGLASKNYTTCVCCRTNVVAYSRLYVP